MIKIQTPILNRVNANSDSFYCWVQADMESWFFCGSQLRDVFGDFPRSVKKIQLVAHDEPGPGRTEIKIVKFSDDRGIDDILIKGESKIRMIDDGAMVMFKKLAKCRRRWWVTLYYWE